MIHKINYHGQAKILIRLTEALNALLEEHSELKNKVESISSNGSSGSGTTAVTYKLTQEPDGHTFSLESSDGYSNTITIPDEDTIYDDSELREEIKKLSSGSGTAAVTYKLTQEPDGHTFTLEGSDGYSNTITIPDEDTVYDDSELREEIKKISSGSGTAVTYKLIQEADGHTFTLEGSDGYSNTITIPDEDTIYDDSALTQRVSDLENKVITPVTYTLTQDQSDGHKLVFTGSDKTSVTITIPDTDTVYDDGALTQRVSDLEDKVTNPVTYTLTQDQNDGHKLVFAGSDNSSVTITIPDADSVYDDSQITQRVSDLENKVVPPVTYTLTQDQNDGHKLFLLGVTNLLLRLRSQIRTRSMMIALSLRGFRIWRIKLFLLSPIR